MKKYIFILLAVAVIAGLAWAVFGGKDGSTADAVASALAAKYSKPAGDFVVVVATDDGQFAKGTVNFKNEAGGGVWFAAKTSSGWELAFDGNGIIDCASADKYNLPKTMVPQCLDAQHNNDLKQR